MTRRLGPCHVVGRLLRESAVAPLPRQLGVLQYRAENSLVLEVHDNSME